MKTLIQFFAVAILALPVLADGSVPAPVHATPRTTTQAVLEVCPQPAQALLLSQVSQTDCCKGHKGVCGCRAGKIVCCDNTVSPNCTCHADSGFEN
ncbi:MAG TPA: hypothetical protein PKH69_00185 [Thiobacillaceae bacterium]|nr:hypothetical protein [Thiobacillaceae bacterium]HNU63468.1 hypothetical protein [Thiobacillaceae bacterium]